MKLAVLGANGRMGRAVVRLAHGAGDAIVCAVGAGAGDEGRDAGELAGVGAIGVPVAPSVDTIASSGADVVVDFSAPPATARALDVCAGAGIAFASGTTGLDDAAKRALDDAAKRVPVLWEPNMSVGVHVLASLVERALATLGEGYDVEIVEAHHRAKVDAPSGTALRLGEVVRAARGERSTRYTHGREGLPGARDPAEIGIHALRGGDVVGDHTVFFFGDGERLELTHRASSRDLFARGALRAARWIAGRPPRRYRLSDVLG
jgi:4-hydroxy-tetrahydrodipicolinate reductase